MNRLLTALAVLALAACASPAPPPPAAPDDGETSAPPARNMTAPKPTPNDRQRLSNLDQHRENAVARMNSEADAADAATVNTLLDAPALTAAPEDLYGAYDCRVIKLGGKDFGLPAILYDWFECRITQGDGALRFRKTTGSQRTEGYLYPEGGQSWLYLGGLRYDDEAPPEYGRGEERDQIARLYRIGENHLRMEFPDPYYESEFNIIELRQ